MLVSPELSTRSALCCSRLLSPACTPRGRVGIHGIHETHTRTHTGWRYISHARSPQGALAKKPPAAATTARSRSNNSERAGGEVCSAAPGTLPFLSCIDPVAPDDKNQQQPTQNSICGQWASACVLRGKTERDGPQSTQQ